MKIALKDLKPNPFRNFDLYPIFPEWIEQLKDSIAHTGYWNGFLAREKDGQYEIPYGHHRKQALEELHGTDYQVEVQIEDMSDNLMRQRMFRENIRNKVQDSAVMLHDIQTAMKYPSDWEKSPVHSGAKGKSATLGKIATFLGREYSGIESVYYALKTEKRDGLTASEMQNVNPRVAQIAAEQIRKHKPSEKAKKQIIEEAQAHDFGPKTAKKRIEEIILDEKYPEETLPAKPKERLDIHIVIFKQILPAAEKLQGQLTEINKFRDSIDFDNVNLSMFAVILEHLQIQINSFLEVYDEKKILQDT